MPGDTTVIAGPDGQIRLMLFTVNGQLNYAVNRGSKPVVLPSAMGMQLDGQDIAITTQLPAPERFSIQESYPWTGAHAIARNNCNGARFLLKQPGRTDTLELRVFNDGAAFRFILPGNDTAGRIPDETTVFRLPGGSVIWYHDLVMHYEGAHTQKKIDEVPKNEWVAPPATVLLPDGGYLSITEADLRNYSGMALQADGSNGLQVRLAHHQPAAYPYELRYSKEDVQRLAQPAVVKGTVITPWRVMMIGADLNTMVNNDIVHNLCPAPDASLFPAGIATDWIKPGRAVWKYLDGGGDNAPATSNRFTDEAAALGFEYNILEGFWQRWSDDTLQYVTRYAARKGIGIWVWMHSKALHDTVKRQAFFKHCHDMGVTGVKIDFFDHEAKEVIDLYQAILAETARYHLLVDFHGANKPTGQSRTWPNELTREAVKGMEASKLQDRATHETTLPFTRCLAGPAEYTVVHFGERRKNTSWAHQIASAAILNAPLLTYAANPASLLSNPAADIIKSIPPVWDETIVLPVSAIGKLAAFARRKGNTWFIAVMNGNESADIRIPLSFLPSGKWKATVVQDDKNNPAALTVSTAVYRKDQVIHLSLAAGGGYIARCSK